MKRLKITVTFNDSVSNYLNKVIIIPAYIAREKHIHDGEAGILSEDETVLKITYRGAIVELPKDKIRVEEGRRCIDREEEGGGE